MSKSNNPYFFKIDDCDKLQKFYDLEFGKNHIQNNLNYNNWQFQNNPFNIFSGKSILLIENDKEVIAHMGLVPFELKIDEQTMKASWLIRLQVSKKFRGEGIGRNLLKYAEKIFDFTLSIDGTFQQRVQKNDEWTIFGKINRHCAILNKNRAEQFLNMKIDNEVIKKDTSTLEFKKTKSINYEYDEFWEKVKVRYPITTNRDSKYIKWRYFEHPEFNYHFMSLKNNEKLVGYAILRFDDHNTELKAGRIIDAVVLEEFECELFEKIINFFDGKVDFIDFYCTGNFYQKTLQEFGFFNNLNVNYKFPNVFDPINLDARQNTNFIFRCNNMDFVNFDKLKKIDNWFFVKGDSDQDRP
jgi:predicted GNAT family N-acyltransferase